MCIDTVNPDALFPCPRVSPTLTNSQINKFTETPRITTSNTDRPDTTPKRRLSSASIVIVSLEFREGHPTFFHTPSCWYAIFIHFHQSQLPNWIITDRKLQYKRSWRRRPQNNKIKHFWYQKVINSWYKIDQKLYWNFRSLVNGHVELP